ncbi:thiopeptide-type bacteriocin biosynthesis protein [Kitasatospora sp. NPDC051914]|uniref:thiopeptide-type bacteriocin biosynthesis protein n=1 Tax=Kitasatospora sp. NPDC051914 TaxID=3154945 RepID=UPI0034400F92
MTTITTTTAILAHLAGTPLDRAAADIGTTTDELGLAVALFTAAGFGAIERAQRREGHHQVLIRFADWGTAEHVAATRIAPRLRDAASEGLLTSWWFIRKWPCWRLRYQPAQTADTYEVQALMMDSLSQLRGDGLVEYWTPTIYEPETCAFGGPDGMASAHRLFHSDSDQILTHSTGAWPIGRRELSVLLCSTMFRSAGLDWFEQGDVWHRVEQMRPLPPEVPTDRVSGMRDALKVLMFAATEPDSILLTPRGRLAAFPQWFEAFARAGTALGDAAGRGTLFRGLRAVLAHHVIFHANRVGLSADTQAILARAAREAAMDR